MGFLSDIGKNMGQIVPSNISTSHQITGIPSKFQGNGEVKFVFGLSCSTCFLLGFGIFCVLACIAPPLANYLIFAAIINVGIYCFFFLLDGLNWFEKDKQNQIKKNIFIITFVIAWVFLIYQIHGLCRQSLALYHPPSPIEIDPSFAQHQSQNYFEKKRQRQQQQKLQQRQNLYKLTTQELKQRLEKQKLINDLMRGKQQRSKIIQKTIKNDEKVKNNDQF